MNLDFLPIRPIKPRQNGVTMVMDKGLSINQAESLCQVASGLIDYIKLGFGTSVCSQGVEQKVALYHSVGIKVYLGGTLFEACYIRSQMQQYYELVKKLQIKVVEVSDGSIVMKHSEKCRIISELSSDFEVLSEVGSKVASTLIPTNMWTQMMNSELKAGSSMVIAEARESGNVGIFDSHAGAKSEMIEQIAQNVDPSKILWEAPLKAQQVWFVKHFGANVNLGNISPQEIVSLETIRLGLRGDTFAQYLPEELKIQTQ